MEEQLQPQPQPPQQPEAHPARVQVSASKKPLHFYVELAKRFLQEHGEVQLSAIGLAIPMMVNLAEILKGNQWAVETRIRTGLDVVAGAAAEGGPNAWPKAKMEIVLQKSPQFDALMAGGGAAGGRGGAASRQGQAQARERRQQQQQQQQVAQQQGQASGSGEGSSSGARQGAAAPRAGTEPAGGAAGGGGAGSSSSGRAAPQLGSSAGPSGEGTTPDVAPTSGPSP